MKEIGRSGNLVALNAGPKPAHDLSARLRDLADAVDRGEILDLIAAYTEQGAYSFLYSASYHDSIVMSAMLHANCIDRMRK